MRGIPQTTVSRGSNTSSRGDIQKAFTAAKRYIPNARPAIAEPMKASKMGTDRDLLNVMAMMTAQR
jgi:hypothetical protein